MSSIKISNLKQDQVLDRKAMSVIRGGSNSWLQGLGPLANVQVGVNQNITQFQRVDVNALNNIGIIGSGFAPLNLNVSPAQFANVAAVF